VPVPFCPESIYLDDYHGGNDDDGTWESDDADFN
jgi:hypothetical protein